MFNHEFLSVLRSAELEHIAKLLPTSPVRVLELGAGRGEQALMLADRGYQVDAIDIASSNYTDARVFEITEYDGRTIPFDNDTFDVVMSSNVLEHVRDLDACLEEIRRVLRPDGVAVHVVPTPAWRWWTTLSAFAAAPQRSLAALRDQSTPWPRRGLRAALLLGTCVAQRRHGERGNVLTEVWWFRPERWRREFVRHGFRIDVDSGMGLFYTGNMVLGNRWSIRRRSKAARVLGSACHVYRMSG